jgi:hypothetical protein
MDGVHHSPAVLPTEIDPLTSVDKGVYMYIYIVPCWRYLLGLRTTPLNRSHSFIADFTGRYYNLSLHRVQIPPDVSEQPLDVLSSRRLASD